MRNKKHFLQRKIQLRLNTNDPAEVKEIFRKLYDWREACFRSANYIVSHHYMMEQIRDLIYLDEGIKVKLADRHKDTNGILNTSKQNTTKRLLSHKFKGQVPLDMLGQLNYELFGRYRTESLSYLKGEKSLPNFKRDIPMPFGGQNIRFAKEKAGREFCFKLFGIPFITYLGKDRNDKAKLMERFHNGTFKVNKGELLIEKNKIFMRLIFEMEKDHYEADPAVIAEASLSLEHPISLRIDGHTFLIGNKEEFLHRRLALQATMRRLQNGATYNKSGHGRKRKFKHLENYAGKEKAYIAQKLHAYSKRIIELCIQHRASALLLVAQQEKEALAKDDAFLLRNWSYYGLKEKLSYKAERAGIMLICE